MGLLAKWCKPNEVYQKITLVPFDSLYKKGYRIALLDMDNTITKDHAVQPEDYTFSAIQTMQKEGFTCCVVSNAKSDRSATISKELGIACVAFAGKPSPNGIFRALELVEGKKEDAVFFGDQLFTDIAAANRAGIYSVLIEPLYKKEVFYVKIKRPFEKIVRKMLKF